MPTPPRLPPPRIATEAQLRKDVDRQLYYGHLTRVRDHRRWRRAELFEASIQWLQKAQAGYDEGANASQWVERYWAPNDPLRIPTPVFNEGLGARQNESARLARPHWRPTVVAKSEIPDLKSRQAAKYSQEMIRHRLKEMVWESQENLVYYHMPMYGGF